jgi:hypothetical protein
VTFVSGIYVVKRQLMISILPIDLALSFAVSSTSNHHATRHREYRADTQAGRTDTSGYKEEVAIGKHLPETKLSCVCCQLPIVRHSTDFPSTESQLNDTVVTTIST